jgi:hypothetical protein
MALMAIIATMALIGVRVLSLVAVFISLKGKAQILFFCYKSAATFSQICLAKPASFSLVPGLPDVASGSFKRPGEVWAFSNDPDNDCGSCAGIVIPGARGVLWCSRAARRGR